MPPVWLFATNLAKSATTRGHFEAAIGIKPHLITNVRPEGDHARSLAIERFFLQRRRKKETYQASANE